MSKQINFFAVSDDLPLIFEALTFCFGTLYVSLRRGSELDVKLRRLDFATFESLNKLPEEWVLVTEAAVDRMDAVKVWPDKSIHFIQDRLGLFAYTPSSVDDKLGVVSIGRFYFSFFDDSMRRNFSLFQRKMAQLSTKCANGMVYYLLPAAATRPILEFWSGVKYKNPLNKCNNQ